MSYGDASARPDKRMTQAQARTQLVQLLYGCTDTALARFTADLLIKTHNVDRKVAEYELTLARQRRVRA